MDQSARNLRVRPRHRTATFGLQYEWAANTEQTGAGRIPGNNSLSEPHRERTARSHGLITRQRPIATLEAMGCDAWVGNWQGSASVILSAMVPKRFSVCASVAALALLVGACSNGGGHHATPTTALLTTTSTPTQRAAASRIMLPHAMQRPQMLADRLPALTVPRTRLVVSSTRLLATNGSARFYGAIGGSGEICLIVQQRDNGVEPTLAVSCGPGSTLARFGVPTVLDSQEGRVAIGALLPDSVTAATIRLASAPTCRMCSAPRQSYATAIHNNLLTWVGPASDAPASISLSTATNKHVTIDFRSNAPDTFFLSGERGSLLSARIVPGRP
jgi:hypothetical protein